MIDNKTDQTKSKDTPESLKGQTPHELVRAFQERTMENLGLKVEPSRITYRLEIPPVSRGGANISVWPGFMVDGTLEVADNEDGTSSVAFGARDSSFGFREVYSVYPDGGVVLELRRDTMRPDVDTAEPVTMEDPNLFVQEFERMTTYVTSVDLSLPYTT